jgi:hypothetical protein
MKTYPATFLPVTCLWFSFREKVVAENTDILKAPPPPTPNQKSMVLRTSQLHGTKSPTIPYVWQHWY